MSISQRFDRLTQRLELLTKLEILDVLVRHLGLVAFREFPEVGGMLCLHSRQSLLVRVVCVTLGLGHHLTAPHHPVDRLAGLGRHPFRFLSGNGQCAVGVCMFGIEIRFASRQRLELLTDELAIDLEGSTKLHGLRLGIGDDLGGPILGLFQPPFCLGDEGCGSLLRDTFDL